MRTRNLATRLLGLIVVLVLSLPANAALVVRGTDALGNQLIYDQDLDLTWYDFVHGIASWQGQVDWASGLSVDFNGVIFDDWRLPKADESCGHRSNCTTNELAHLYHEEFADPFLDRTPFVNFMASDYWTGTEFSPDPASFAWAFDYIHGVQVVSVKNPASSFGCKFCRGMAVRDGDVLATGASSVPEPSSALLFGIGLIGGLMAWRCRSSGGWPGDPAPSDAPPPR